MSTAKSRSALRSKKQSVSSDSARKHGCKLAGAPDTLLGAAHRKCRQLLGEGVIGEIVSASAVFMTHGMEHWHPAPKKLFPAGGGPVFDIGPYYIAALVCMLGPLRISQCNLVHPASQNVLSRRTGGIMAR